MPSTQREQPRPVPWRGVRRRCRGRRGVRHEFRAQRATAADPPAEAALRVRQDFVDPPAPL
eukprot:4276618-Pyramimonas_sp.AAC.1